MHNMAYQNSILDYKVYNYYYFWQVEQSINEVSVSLKVSIKIAHMKQLY